MKPRFFVVGIVLAAMQVMTLPSSVRGDTLVFKDGTRVEGTVRKVAKGRVTVQVGEQTQVFDILEITSMEFETPHLPEGTPRLPLEHFLANIEAQEMIGHFEDVEESAARVRKLIEVSQKEWAPRNSLTSSEMPQWETAKEGFRRPLSRYQEVLNDLYFHVLGKVDEYNRLMEEADAIHVGVKGWFQYGSSLISRDLEKLPLKKYVPSNWYDTIYFQGYQMGYNDAHEKYSTRFRE